MRAGPRRWSSGSRPSPLDTDPTGRDDSHRDDGVLVTTLWHGRFESAPDPAAFDFGVSFGFDRALFEDDVTGSVAWAEALAAAEVLSNADATAIVNALHEILEQGRHDPS